ncbi:MAG TPA: peptide-methionine (R)-S-oxide reductase MsrB [Candidatus Paceibacterota bacterium]
MEEKDWKEKLTPEEYKVLREGGTEVPYSGEYWKTNEKGMYRCKVCGSQLFSSDTKFESKEPGLKGWPSFDNALPGAVEFKEDKNLGMRRTEVVCAKCGSHLGHVFDTGEESKTGKHYCINSVCLKLERDSRAD